MRLAALVLLAAALSTGCAARSMRVRPVPEPWREVPQASSRKGISHICPFAPHLAYTARHVVLDRQGIQITFIPLIWKQGEASGMLIPLYVDARRDLAIGCSDEPFLRPFERAVEAPEPGDRLYLPAHEWLRKGGPRKRQEVVVAEVVGGTIRLEALPMFASSGACLLDAEGRLVAVYDGGFGPVTGNASYVSGDWGEIPPKWRDTETFGWIGASLALEGCATEYGWKR